jgi:hypothetical protein
MSPLLVLLPSNFAAYCVTTPECHSADLDTAFFAGLDSGSRKKFGLLALTFVASKISKTLIIAWNPPLAE